MFFQGDQATITAENTNMNIFQALDNAIRSIRMAENPTGHQIEILNSLQFNSDWAMAREWTEEQLKDKLQDLSLFWTGQDEEIYPTLKTLRTLTFYPKNI